MILKLPIQVNLKKIAYIIIKQRPKTIHKLYRPLLRCESHNSMQLQPNPILDLDRGSNEHV